MEKDELIAYQFEQIKQLTARVQDLERLIYGDKREKSSKTSKSKAAKSSEEEVPQEEKPVRKSRSKDQNRQAVSDKWASLGR